MARVKSGLITKKKHKKLLKLAKGYRMTRHKQFKKAKEAVLHAGEYAYVGRKKRKREFRKLWIIRLNAVLRSLNLNYSKFIHLLKQKNIILDRKILAQVSVEHPKIFKKIVQYAQH
jgi:large subunit ribosomal protein L20